MRDLTPESVFRPGSERLRDDWSWRRITLVADDTMIPGAVGKRDSNWSTIQQRVDWSASNLNILHSDLPRRPRQRFEWLYCWL